MKLILENWRKYLLTEQSELWGYHLRPEQKVFISKEPYTDFRNVRQEPHQKPAGLWYGCGDGWIEWLRSDMPQWLEESTYLYEIKLGSDVLQISNNKEFQNLEDKFKARDRFGREVIDWDLVQEAGHSGIEICPYNYDRRMTSDWYYGWDVGSGCIWDSRGITEITLLAERSEEEIEARSVRAKEQERIKELVAFKEKVKKAVEADEDGYGCGDWFYNDDYMREDWESIDPYEMSEEEFMQKLADHVMDNCGFDIEKWH
jgi:hypothetical protein